MSELQKLYKEKVVKHLMSELNQKNVMAVPKIKKVVINAGVGKTLKDPKYLDAIISEIKNITGQQPVKTLAKKSIAGFKIRENQVVGLMVTLRGRRMYDFLEKMIRVALPRVRDFRGLNPKSFDGRGNYSIGFKEQIVFPETAPDSIDHVFGFEVNIQTSAGNDKAAYELLKALGMPFQKIN
jgi:large subunit ribosomal protein L5